MSTRLRRTFHYPSASSDSDSSSSSRNIDDELDSDAQAALIADLRAHDARMAALYRGAFTALPLLAALLFVPAVLRDSRGTLLAVSSLLASAWTVWGVEAPRPAGVRKGEAGPVDRYLPVLNGVLAGVLGIRGVVVWRGGDGVAGGWGVVPLVIYGVVMVARHELRPVDIDGLEKLRYEYKGA